MCQKIKMHGTLTTIELRKQSNRTTRLVRWWMERNHSEVAGCTGRTYLRGNGDSELSVDYGGCHGGRNFQSYRRVR